MDLDPDDRLVALEGAGSRRADVWRHRCGRSARMALDEAADADERLLELLVRGRVARPDVALARRPERDPGITATCSSVSRRSANASDDRPVADVTSGNA